MPYRVIPRRILTRNTTLQHYTRTMYYAVHGKPPQLYPLRSGGPFPTFDAAQSKAYQLSLLGYSGWIMRLQEVRQVDWPDNQWLIDYGAEEPIVRMKQF